MSYFRRPRHSATSPKIHISVGTKRKCQVVKNQQFKLKDMEQIILISLFFSFCLSGISQDTVKLYLDINFNQTVKEKAVVLRTAIINNKHYYITDQYLNGRMINYGEFISFNPWVEDGLAKNYNESGGLYSTGNYLNGKISGKWIYLKNGKTDTIDYSLVENFYNTSKDSCSNSRTIVDMDTTKNILKIKKDMLGLLKKNFHVPARVRDENLNSEIEVNFTIDKDGYVKCPEIINSKNIDYDYEILRILFLYQADFDILNPISLKVPVNIQHLTQNEEEPVFIFVEEQASFQGGDISTFRKYVEMNLVYPAEASKEKIQGNVIVQFAINSEGFLVDTKVLRSANPYLDKEALRCIESSPRWVPARQSGRPVKQLFVIPVTFILLSSK